LSQKDISLTMDQIRVFLNLLIFQENITKFFEIFEKTPLEELEKEFSDFLDRLIKEKREEKLHANFFDWTFKLDSLIISDYRVP